MARSDASVPAPGPTLRRIVLVRHGETEGQSSIRFFGTTDVDLSREGRAQMRAVAARVGRERFDLVMASPLRRAWRSAGIVSPGAAVRVEPDFREVDFGRWEGLTREEIQARDPILAEDWEKGSADFQYPQGESRRDFAARVGRGLESLLAARGASALLVVHKGVIRAIYAQLTGGPIEGERPELGELVELTAVAPGRWIEGRRSSNPPDLAS